MTEAVTPHPERPPQYHLVTFLILIPATGFPLLFGFGLAVFMPTWLAPPDVHTWNTIHLYIVVCELLWFIPTILILRLRKFFFHKSHFIMLIVFLVIWGFLIFAILGEDKYLLTFWMMDETAVCERQEFNNHVYYHCHGYFGEPDNQWGVRFEGSPSIPLVSAPCLVGLCN